MKKLLSIVALVVFSFAAQAGTGCIPKVGALVCPAGYSGPSEDVLTCYPVKIVRPVNSCGVTDLKTLKRCSQCQSKLPSPK
jgi:hypothetical protein